MTQASPNLDPITGYEKGGLAHSMIQYERNHTFQGPDQIAVSHQAKLELVPTGDAGDMAEQKDDPEQQAFDSFVKRGRSPYMAGTRGDRDHWRNN